MINSCACRKPLLCVIAKRLTAKCYVGKGTSKCGVGLVGGRGEEKLSSTLKLLSAGQIIK